jgi:fibronectin-binding autotransporter adhesin
MKSKRFQSIRSSFLPTHIALTLGLAVAGLSTQSAQAASVSWNGGTGTWETTSNWSTSALPTSTDTAVFAGTAGTVTVGATDTALGLQFTTTDYTLASGGLTLGFGGIDASSLTSGTTTIASALTLNGSQAWSVGAGGTLAVSGTVTRNAGAAVNFVPTGTINLTGSGLANDATGILGGWATVGNTGASGATADWAALDLSGNIVTYTGYTAISSGANSSQTLSGTTASQNWKTSSGASGYSTTLTNSGTINSLVVQGDVVVGAGNTLTLGSGGLILSGISRWIKAPNGNSSDTGMLTSGLANGELFVDVASATSDANNWRIWNKIVDNGGTAVSVVKNGPGYLRLENANTYTGGTILNGGILAVGANTVLGSGTLTLNAGTVQGNVSAANFASAVANNIVVNGSIGFYLAKDANYSGTISGSGTLDTTAGNGTASLSISGSLSGFNGTFKYLSGTNNQNNVNLGGSTDASMDMSGATIVLSGATAGGARNLALNGAGPGNTFKVGDLSGAGQLTVNVGTLQVGALNQTSTFSGVIKATAASVQKVGTGTWTLTGANTFTGGVALNGGKINLGSSGAISSSGNITFGGGTLQYSSSNTTDYSPRIATGTSPGAVSIDTNGQNVTFATALTSSQSGGLAKAGTGTLTLSASNAYTGTTTINGGTLKVNGSIGSMAGVTVNSGATLTGSGSVSGTTTVANGGILTNGNSDTSALTLSALTYNGTGTVNINTAGSAGVVVTNALTTANTGAGEITVNATNSSTWTAGSYDLITFSSGSLTGTAADFSLSPISGLSGRQSATLGTSSTAVTLTIAGDLPVWTGVGSQTWTTAATNNTTGPNAWALGTGHTGTNFWASDTVKFNDTYNLGSGDVAVTNSTVTITGGVSPTNVIFNNSAVNYVIRSNDSTGIAAGSLTKGGTGTVTINTANSYTGATTINNGTLVTAAGSLGGTASIAVTGGTLDAVDYNSAATLTVGASGTANISGTGLSLGSVSNANSVSYTGATGTITLASLSGAGSTNFASNATTTGGISSGTVTVSGLLTSDISGGTTTVGGVATVGTMSGGTLNLNGATGAITTLNGGTVNLGGATVLTVSAGTSAGSITGGGSLVINSGTLTLTGSNSYTGGTTVNGGTLSVGNVGALGSGALTLNSGNVNANSSGANFVSAITNNIVVNGNVGFYCGSKDATYSGAITGSGTLNNGAAQGNASLNINGDLSGFTGTFAYASGGNYNNVNIGGSTTASMDLSHAKVVISGSGPSAAYRTLNLSGSGSTVFQVGDLSGTSGFLYVSAPTVSVGSLGLNSTFAGAIAGDNNATDPVNVTKVGAGTWTLSGTNNYTGATSVNAGTLALASTGSISPSTSVHVAAGAVLDTSAKTSFALAASQPVTFDVNPAGSGSSGKIHAGALDITNASVAFNLTGTLDDAAYVIADYTSLTGTAFATATAPTGYTINYSYNGSTQIALVKNAGYDSWATAKGLTGANNGPQQDPNNNGITNLMEYVLNGDPLNGESPQAILPTQDSSGANLVFTFHRLHESASDTTQVFQYGTDLTGWTDVAIAAGTYGSVTVAVTADFPATGIDEVVVTVPKGVNDKLFGRLYVTKP